MSEPAWHFENETLVIELRVQPRASRDEVTGIVGGRLKVRVSAPPVDDAANDRLKAFLAKEFGVSRGRVRILSGQTGREKRIAIDQPRRVPEWLAELGEIRATGKGG
ncbi:MAG TPA: DUF167 family protein [Gammaproteobacteria bacterium]|nr:DUF167 family protein [Gammaproteobacteria bacterium]